MAIDPVLQQQSQPAQQRGNPFIYLILWRALKFFHRTTAYQHYPYTSHYPQAAYATHYSYASPQSTTTTAAATTTTQTQQPQSSSLSSQQTRQYSTNTYNINASASNGMDVADIATLNDALGSAGVDLRVSFLLSL
jgi:hypothetical protein